MIKNITSKDNPRVKYAVSLRDSKNRKISKEFIGESYKSLLMAISANLVKEVFTYKELEISQEITQYIVSEEIMKKLSSTTNPEGVVFIAKFQEYKKDKYSKILYLDHINDPGNMGTMIRTALAFNFDAVITSKDSVSLYNDKVLAAAKGANYLIPVFEDDLSKYQNGFMIISSSLENGSIDLKDFKAPKKFVLVMGNEAHGISDEVKKISNVFLKIGINNIDSLNVSTAASILMYELTK